MLIDWNAFQVLEIAPGVRQRQVELDGLFVALQEMTSSDPDEKMNTHAHPHQQAGYVLEGEMELLIGDQMHVIKTGEAYMVPPDAEHGARARGSVRLLNFYVAPGPDYIDTYRAKNSPRKDESA